MMSVKSKSIYKQFGYSKDGSEQTLIQDALERNLYTLTQNAKKLSQKHGLKDEEELISYEEGRL